MALLEVIPFAECPIDYGSNLIKLPEPFFSWFALSLEFFIGLRHTREMYRGQQKRRFRVYLVGLRRCGSFSDLAF